MVLTKFLVKDIFVKQQDLEKETEFRFLIGYPTNGLRLFHYDSTCELCDTLKDNYEKVKIQVQFLLFSMKNSFILFY